jgi:lipopolysaccharide biosynthesis glycosyltransferase
MLRIFIGFDAVETVAYHTLVQSILNHCSEPVSITPIKLSMLPEYTRKRLPEQSNEFSFTRFLVPYLCGYEGKALFMDCDMIFRTDPKEIFGLIEENQSVAVVKHDYIPKNKTKYLGAIQYQYPRKNWSSVMLFNCGHEHCKRLTPEFINTADPATLHRFHWTHDDYIGELPVEWNHLVGEYPPNKDAKIVHWTIGGPYFVEYADTEFAGEWIELERQINHCQQMTKMREA